MTTLTTDTSLHKIARADQALHRVAALWFLTATIGQWIFVYYIIAYYGLLTVQKGWEGLNETHLPTAYIPGDIMGNSAIFTHLFLAVVVIGGGPLQLIPQIRARFPTFHRWMGRIYMPTVFVISMAGLYMVWVRGSVGDLVQHIGLSLDAVLIIVFAAMALRYAIARKIDIHRRWALRLFMVVNGVWFARVGLWLWLFLTGGLGIDMKTFTGPFLSFWAFGQYLLPLAVLELYLHTQDRAGTPGRFTMATALFVLTVAMGIGIFEATMGMWLPRL